MKSLKISSKERHKILLMKYQWPRNGEQMMAVIVKLLKVRVLQPLETCSLQNDQVIRDKLRENVARITST